MKIVLATVKADYLKFLSKFDSRVPAKKNRPFVVGIFKISEHEYALPITLQDKKQQSKKRSPQLMYRMTDTKGNWYGDILLNNMIPVTDDCYEKIEISQDNEKYDYLVMINRVRLLQRDKEKINEKAKVVHMRRGKGFPFFVKLCCNFSKLEDNYLNYGKHQAEREESKESRQSIRAEMDKIIEEMQNSKTEGQDRSTPMKQDRDERY